ncbi:hypothetical protein BDN67DRAFT_971154 [Paxillus ammoniavirescens]|nr:hypothetical protein BDN67DRAFT_971154 [Paxillus ammoniavirescens]
MGRYDLEVSVLAGLGGSGQPTDDELFGTRLPVASSSSPSAFPCLSPSSSPSSSSLSSRIS